MKIAKVCRSALSRFGLTIALVVLVVLFPLAVLAGELTVAAASDLNFAFKELVAAYEEKTGDHVKLSLGSSGNFYSQIRNGAPFDLYFSADIAYPKKLEDAGLAVRGTLYKYAIGRLVVWAPSQSPLAVDTQGIQVLLDPSVRKIAIANPKHAPYGRAAVGALEHFQLHDRVRDKLVLGENISQTAQFVQSRAADVGIIALSLALAPAMRAGGKYWEIPTDAHPPLEQGAVVLKSSTNQDAARAFLDFLRSETGQAIMNRYGFVLPS